MAEKNRLLSLDEFAQAAMTLLVDEVERSKRLTPEQLQAEIDALPYRDRFWVEHGYYPPDDWVGHG